MSYEKDSTIRKIKNIYYYMGKSLRNIEDKESAYYCLSVALNYAKDLDVNMARFEEQIEQFDWKEILNEAKKQAKEELKNDE